MALRPSRSVISATINGCRSSCRNRWVAERWRKKGRSHGHELMPRHVANGPMTGFASAALPIRALVKSSRRDVREHLPAQCFEALRAHRVASSDRITFRWIDAVFGRG